MKIFLISGSWPPDVCGVGDHIDGLRKSLIDHGTLAVPVRLSKYGILTALGLALRSWYRPNERAVLAYPTEGYGRSIVPFVMALSKPGSLLVHMHEYGSKNAACRWLLRLFRHQSTLYFSNTADRESYVNDTGIAPGTTSVRQVLPSPSNIEALSLSVPAGRTGPTRILHFGQIRPRKGIEQVLDVFARFKAIEPDARLTIAGAIPKGYESFARQICVRAAGAGVDIRLGLDPAALSAVIAEADMMFLPYPGGADEKRGTLAAGLAHGTVCVTTYGVHTSALLRTATIGLEPLAGTDVEDEWTTRCVALLLDTGKRARHGDLQVLADAALRYTEYASFRHLAEQTVSALGVKNV